MSHPYPDAPPAGRPASPPAFTPPPSRELVKPVTQAEIDAILAPHVIDMRTWLRGILTEEDFPESDPDAMALGMLAQILMAETSEEALAMFNLDRARDMCGNEPGGRSPVLDITGARPLKSTYSEGAACYSIIAATRLDTGAKIQFTTGSKAVQMLVWKHVHMGWVPFRAMLEIRREKTQRGFHPLNLVAGI